MWWFALIPIVMACGSPSAPPVPNVDAPPPPVDTGCAAAPCDAVGQTGCTNKKCSWVVDQDELGHGHVGCVFDGATPIGLPCTRDMFGADTCVKGTTCYQGQCRSICDLQGPAGACSATLTCQPTDLFHHCASTTAVAGLCL
ncbi:hypothetical protein BH11MYX3_BH11MYX3_02760 [soil metagenome]